MGLRYISIPVAMLVNNRFLPEHFYLMGPIVQVPLPSNEETASEMVCIHLLFRQQTTTKEIPL